MHIVADIINGAKAVARTLFGRWLAVTLAVTAVVLPGRTLSQASEAESSYAEGLELFENGKYEAALEKFKAVLAADQSATVVNQELTGADRHWISHTLYRMGRTDEAKKYEPSFYELRPVDRTECAEIFEYSQRCMSSALAEMALYWAEECLAKEKELLGVDHHYVFGSYYTIATIYFQQGNEAECRKYIQLAKEQAERIKVSTTQWKAQPYLLEASLDYALNDESGGDSALEKAGEYLGDEILALPDVYSNFIQLYVSRNFQKNPQETTSEIARIVKVLTDADTETWSGSISLIRTVNDFAINTGNYNLGLGITESLVGTMDRNSPDYPMLLFDYGRLLNLSGAYRRGLDCLTETLSAMQSKYPRDPQHWVDVLFSMGQCNMNLHRYDDAVGNFEQALKIYRRMGDSSLQMTILTLHKLAAIHSLTNKFDEAVNYIDECLDKMKRSGVENRYDYAFLYKEKAVCRKPSDRSKSAEAYRKAIDLVTPPQTLQEKDLYCDCVLSLAAMECDTDSVELIALNLMDSLCTDDSADAMIRYRTYSALVELLSSGGADDKVLGYADAAISAAQGTPLADLSNLISMYTAKCLALSALGRNDEAWSIAEKLYEDIEKQFGKNSIQHIFTIMLYQTLTDRSLSVSRLQQLPQMAEDVIAYLGHIDVDDSAYLPTAVLASKCLGYTDPLRSIEILESCLDKIPALKNNPLDAMSAYVQLSSLSRNTGNLDKSFYYSNLCAENINLLPDNLNSVMAYYEIGQNYILCNRFNDAERLLLKGVEITKKVNPDHFSLAFLYSSLQQLYEKMGQQGDATDYSVKRSRLFSMYDDNDLVNIADVEAKMWSKYNLGLKDECFADILQIEKYASEHPEVFPDKSLTDMYKARYYYMEQDYGTAAKHVEDALRKMRGYNALYLAAQIYYAMKDYDTATAYANESADYVARILAGNNMDLVRSYYLIAEICLAKGDLSAGLEYYSRAFDLSVRYIDDNILTFTSRQRADFWNSNSIFYLQYLPYLATSNDFPTGINGLLYNATLFSNGLLLNADKSISQIVQQSSPKIKELYREYVNRKAVLNNTGEKLNQKWKLLDKKASHEQVIEYMDEEESLEQLKHECESTERMLINSIRDDNHETMSYRSYTWNEVLKKLPGKSAAVEYIVYSTDSQTNTVAALVLKKGVREPAFRVLFSYPKDREFRKDEIYSSTWLGDSLINSLADILSGCRDVYFAPHGFLCSVGVESLPRTPNPGTAALNLYRVSSTRVIAEKRGRQTGFEASLFGGINYDTSIDSLKSDADKYPQLRTRAFAAGDIFRAKRMGDVEIEPLPGTLTEVTAIDSLLTYTKHIKPTLKTGNDGTESAFKALSGQYGAILHVSTHGFFNDGEVVLNPNVDAVTFEDAALEQSGLLMAGASHRFVNDEELPDNLDDGVLTASEIARLDLGKVDLAVLSACETALGTVTGEGVFGLQRGFKKAGVNSILMSLWKVDDDATCTLMNEFYRNWIAGKSKYESLELAKKHVRGIEKWHDPEFWAAFILLDALN